MIRRPTRAGRLNATELKFSQIEGRNEGVDHANRIVICNPVIQAFRQQSRLPAISPFNEARHTQPPPIQCGNHTRQGVFTQPGSVAVPSKAAPGNTMLQHNRDYYLRLRREYQPKIIKLIIVAESPPASGKYFYDSTGSTKEPLFAAF